MCVVVYIYYALLLCQPNEKYNTTSIVVDITWHVFVVESKDAMVEVRIGFYRLKHQQQTPQAYQYFVCVKANTLHLLIVRVPNIDVQHFLFPS